MLADNYTYAYKQGARDSLAKVLSDLDNYSYPMHEWAGLARARELVQAAIDEVGFVDADNKVDFEMRDATSEERASVNAYVQSIAKDTGVNFYDEVK